MPASLQRSKLNNLPQAAEQLGVSVECLRSSDYSRRTIPYVKVGRAVRISDETIENIIERGTVAGSRGAVMIDNAQPAQVGGRGSRRHSERH